MSNNHNNADEFKGKKRKGSGPQLCLVKHASMVSCRTSFSRYCWETQHNSHDGRHCSYQITNTTVKFLGLDSPSLGRYEIDGHMVFKVASSRYWLGTFISLTCCRFSLIKN